MRKNLPGAAEVRFHAAPLLFRRKAAFMYKGIFWFCRDAAGTWKALAVKVPCGRDGTALFPIRYSSKAGENFNHKAEWERLGHKITGGRPYNYYPRGRVEIRKGRITVYIPPSLFREDILSVIFQEFGLNGEAAGRSIRVKADGSAHYQYQTEEAL